MHLSTVVNFYQILYYAYLEILKPSKYNLYMLYYTLHNAYNTFLCVHILNYAIYVALIYP